MLVRAGASSFSFSRPLHDNTVQWRPHYCQKLSRGAESGKNPVEEHSGVLRRSEPEMMIWRAAKALEMEGIIAKRIKGEFNDKEGEEKTSEKAAYKNNLEIDWGQVSQIA
jgi:hypothetical protein